MQRDQTKDIAFRSGSVAYSQIRTRTDFVQKRLESLAISLASDEPDLADTLALDDRQDLVNRPVARRASEEPQK